MEREWGAEWGKETLLHIFIHNSPLAYPRIPSHTGCRPPVLRWTHSWIARRCRGRIGRGRGHGRGVVATTGVPSLLEVSRTLRKPVRPHPCTQDLAILLRSSCAVVPVQEGLPPSLKAFQWPSLCPLRLPESAHLHSDHPGFATHSSFLTLLNMSFSVRNSCCVHSFSSTLSQYDYDHSPRLRRKGWP